MAEKRIIELAEATGFQSGDFMVVDSSARGTKKIDARIISSMTGSPLVAATAAAMTDTNKIYVYTGSEAGYTAGNWYYYDGDSWESGGVYNSTAFETDDTLTQPGAAADAKAVGDKFDEVEGDINSLGLSVVSGKLCITYTE